MVETGHSPGAKSLCASGQNLTFGTDVGHGWADIADDGLGDLIWKTERSERLWIATGPPQMPTTSTGSTRFTERTRCSNIRNRASAFEEGKRSSSLAPRSRTGNASPCGG